MPEAMGEIGGAAVGGKLYVMGGFLAAPHQGARDDAFVLDPKADRWSARLTLSSPRGAVTAAALDGKIHVIGERGRGNRTGATHEASRCDRAHRGVLALVVVSWCGQRPL
jgi:hypothetical protein